MKHIVISVQTDPRKPTPENPVPIKEILLPLSKQELLKQLEGLSDDCPLWLTVKN